MNNLKVLDKHLYIKVSRDIAIKAGYYLMDDSNYYIAFTKYIIEIMPVPFGIVDVQLTDNGIICTIKTPNIVKAVDALLGIASEIHITKNGIVFILVNG